MPLTELNPTVVIVDDNGYVPLEQIPPSIKGALVFRGTWDAANNNPNFASGGVGASKGEYYVVTVAGSTNLDGYSNWNLGDWVINQGESWYLLDNSTGVQSLNGLTGYLNITTDDIPETLQGEPVNKYFTETRVIQTPEIVTLLDLQHEAGTDTSLATGTSDFVSASELRVHLDELSSSGTTSEFIYPDGTTGLLLSKGNPHQTTALQTGALPLQKFYDHSMDYINPHRVKLKNLTDVKFNGVGYDLTSKRADIISSDTGTAYYAIDDIVDGVDADGNTVIGTMWVATHTLNEALYFDFGVTDRQEVTGLTIVPNFVNGNSSVTSFEFYGSNDVANDVKTATYDLLYTHTGVPDSNAIYTIGTPQLYAYYKLVILTSDAPNIATKAVQLFGNIKDLGLRYDDNGETIIAQKRLPNYDELIYLMNRQNLLGAGSIVNFDLQPLEVMIGNNNGQTVRGKIVKNEVITTIDSQGPNGFTTEFYYTHSAIEGTLEVFVSGMSMLEGVAGDLTADYSVDYVNKKITFNSAPYTADILKVHYIYDVSS